MLSWRPLADDLRLNSLVFQWPEQILVELENSKLRLAAMREKSEGCLTTRSLSSLFSPCVLLPSTLLLPLTFALSLRVVDFEQRLLVLDEDIQAFKKKEVMNMDEMRNNVGNLRQISDRLEAALMELEVRVLI